MATGAASTTRNSGGMLDAKRGADAKGSARLLDAEGARKCTRSARLEAKLPTAGYTTTGPHRRRIAGGDP